MEDEFDLFDSCYDDSDLYEFNYEQSMISRKSESNCFSVEREYINSKEFYDKFERIPVNRETQLSIYHETCRLLEFVDGRSEERMCAISARTGKFIVDNFSRNGVAEKTGFTTAEREKIENCPDFIITIHNHSYNGRPSAQDILTCLENDKVKISLITCHTGDIYLINDVKPKFKELYNKFLSEEKQNTSNAEEAKILATTRLYIKNDALAKRHKIFTIQRL